MKEKINYNIAKAEAMIKEALLDLPVGVGYLILKNKLNEIQSLYYNQAMKEADEIKEQQGQQS